MEISASRIYFLLLLLVVLHCCLAAAVRTNITTDQSALLVLKDRITDDPQKILATNWSSSAGSPCNWVGITCDANHHRVTALNLSHMGLNGTIPPHLGNLSFLTNLYIRANHFHGSLPGELAYLRRLKFLSFGENNFNGEIPSWLGLLPKLEGLALYSNSFRGTIPPSLFNTSSQVRMIQLDQNMLSGGVPTSLRNCTSLTLIYLSDNNLTGEVPAEIGNLPNLEELDIGNNSLTGFIPYSIFNHSTIRAISLGMNFLSGQLPSGIGNWVPNLEELYLWGNEINGTIPSSISNASTLSVLELAENYFYGSIPYTLGNLRQLEDLFLHNNLLTRESATIELSFLSSLTNCRKLRMLDLGENPLLNGTLPISIGNFSGSLEYFKASGCNIKGNIPKQIGNLSNLLVLKLQDNELDGPIPSTVRGMRNLQGLYLDGNRLQGSIPNVICDLSKLSELFFSGNKLYGSLPTCWKSLTSLRKLFLDANHLTSNLPSSLWSLGDILQINLSLNSLSGPLPSDIGNLKVVTLLDLSWNQLSGQIPAAIGGLQNLENLSLAHNKFQGFIPQSLGQSTNMQVLDLSHNNLSGVIPKSLEKLKHLKNLDVSFNRLDGEIPSGMDIAIFSAQSFMGNEGLCGPPRFKVPPCQVFGRSKAHTSVRLAYILPAVIAAILVLILILFLKITLKRNAKSASQEAPTLATWRRISYLELERATDRFSETNLVGQGSFGSVYSGTLSDGMSVAVKVFNLEIQGSFKSFDAECEVLRRIRHRNLVKIISCCSNNNFKALVLEYMPNGSLHKWLYSHNYYLDILQRMNIMIDVASSLEYLHHGSHVPVVHCDLKPSNILLDDDMIAHVGDFGISKLLGDGDSMTQTLTLATIGYMAPEYGSQGIISTSGDVYSYGILLMETFTRKKPTDDMFSGEMSQKHWVKESLPHAIIKVVDSNLLQKDDQRFEAKQDCIFSIMRLAMDCLAEAPEERMEMRDVIKTLKNIKMEFVDGDLLRHTR